ncbi:hypothetical protein GIY23_05000 [Allosaccharopolyspora coralli]|uniref:Uncharacterized protein n=2 Tax=Allosaccharopolyspora coralli TaxID=2665642 RepID=A0A5Q3QKX1_9PSEU|nr:hypothetical protein GIY23_05000 [Allosaccharopolyspora coralli]
MPALNPASEIQERAKEKLDAYREIQAMADNERRRERTAHRTLLKAMSGANGIVEAFIANPMTWVARGLTYMGVAHGTSSALALNAQKQKTFIEEFKKLSTDMPPAQREAHLTKLNANMGVDERGAKSNARLVLGGGKTLAGEAILGQFSRTLGGQGNSRLAGMGRLFNVVGVVGAGTFTVTDIASGKPVAKSVWTNFGGLAFSVGASSVATAAASGGVGAAAGGPITALGLGVGFTAATAWTYFQDHDFRDLYRDLGGDGGNSPDDYTDERRKARFGR